MSARATSPGSPLASRSALAAAAAIAAPAGASQQITSFNASVSTSQAGGHPDLSYDFGLENPGQPEAAKEVDPQPAARASSATPTRSRAARPATSPCSSARPPRRSGS